MGSSARERIGLVCRVFLRRQVIISIVRNNGYYWQYHQLPDISTAFLAYKQ